MTVAAPRHPKVTPDHEFAVPSHLEDLREKIRLVYRMAALNGNQFVVLGEFQRTAFPRSILVDVLVKAALGCGAFKCPAKVVSREMKHILLGDEFKGWFKQVMFAVYSTPSYGASNFATFEEALHGVQL